MTGQSDKQERFDEVRKAAAVLMEAGFHIAIPGMYSIGTPEKAAAFAQDPDAYYRALYIAQGEKTTEKLRKKAQEAGAPFEEYIHFFHYSDPWGYYEWEELIGGECNEPGGSVALCAYRGKNGEKCRNSVKRLPFDLGFADFRPGVHDRCHQHCDDRAIRSSRNPIDEAAAEWKAVRK